MNTEKPTQEKETMTRLQIRDARPEDREQIMKLIDTVYREYGDQLAPEGADSDLLDIDSYYRRRGGVFVVLEGEDGCVRGTHAVLPMIDRPGVCWFRRLYLDRSLRGGPWGKLLMDWAITWAREHGFRRVEFWSDTRFERAHAFFARVGFQRDGRVRSMADGSMPYEEYFFYLVL